MRHRAPSAVFLAALVALAPVLAGPVVAAPVAAPAAVPAGVPIATAPKVVIVVGATEGTTASYRADADTIAAEALKYTPNVVKLYSPNATWAAVRDAAEGASIFVYLGHGYGFPSPYRPVLSPSVQDGMGLNEFGGIDDWDKKYYGESLIASDIRFAKGAIVLLNHLCYSAGSSESGDPEPTIPVARERVDNFASGFIRAGARAVIAQSWTSGVTYAIRSIFTTDQPILDMWSAAPNRQGHEQAFVPVRNPQLEARLDPDTWTTGFHRSIVAAAGFRTTDVVDGAAAASTMPSPDGVAPELWSIDGPTTITPDHDGVADGLSLLARYSESVAWTATIRDPGGEVVGTQAGSGHQAAISWDPLIDGAPAPDGDYTWTLAAADGAGNGPVGNSGSFRVVNGPPPTTGVLSFGPTTPTSTTASTVSYALHFASPVTGLEVTDFTRTGSAQKCVVNAPVGSGADYALSITGCGTGTVGLYLNAGTVLDGGQTAGPAGPISAARVTIDRSAPKATIPRPILRTGISLPTTSTTQPLLVTLTWTGSDTGSGIASYDVARSYDGATYKTIASGLTMPQLNVTMNVGHAYKFRVRARDKAGNVGAWTTAYTWYPKLVQQGSSAIVYSAFGGNADPAFSNGRAKSATRAGASATYSFSGRAISFVTTLRPTAGEVQVWVDGSLAATIDTYSETTIYRYVAFSRTWSSYGSHRIKLVVVGTAGHPRVDLDAFEVVR